MRLGLVALAILATLAVACAGSTSTVPAAPQPGVVVAAASHDEVTLEVQELLCLSCRSKITNESKQIAGVTSVSLDLEARAMTLRFDGARTTREQVVAAVEDIVARAR